MSLSIGGVGAIGSVGAVRSVDKVDSIAAGSYAYGKKDALGIYDEEVQKTSDEDSYIPVTNIMGSSENPMPSSIYDASGMQVADAAGTIQTADGTGTMQGDGVGVDAMPESEEGTFGASGSGGSGESGSSDSEETTKIVVIDGATYLETTVTENGVTTVTRTLIRGSEDVA